MSADTSTLVIPGHGTVFKAPKNTLPPTNPLTAFTLTGTSGSWVNLGHTSKQNSIEFTKDGGDKTALDTFLADAVRYTSESVSWGVNIPALQFDTTNLGLAFNGGFDPVTGGYTVAPGADMSAALFLLFQDVSASLGFWIPSTTVSIGDAPSVDTSNFMELPLSAAIQSADSGVIAPVNGRAGIFQIFKTGLAPAFKNWAATITGTPTGGTFSLLVDGVATAGIAYNAATTAVASALNAVPGITGATVSGSVGAYAITFTSAHAVTVDPTGLTGGTSPNVTLAGS